MPVPRRHRGAVIGGIVAGVLGLLAILLAAGLCWFYRLRYHSKAKRDSVNSFRTREAKLNTNTLYFRPEATIPSPSVSTDKHAFPKFNADGISAGLQDSPFGYLGGQQAQKRQQPQHQTDSTSAALTSPEGDARMQANFASGPLPHSDFPRVRQTPVLFASPRKVDLQKQPESSSAVFASSGGNEPKQTDPARDPSATSSPSTDQPRPVIFAGPEQVYLEQQLEYSTSGGVPMSSGEESVRSPSMNSGSPSDRQSPVFFESSKEVDEREFPSSAPRTAMGARLREVIRAEEAHPEYGTVIGIGMWISCYSVPNLSS